MTKYGAQCQVLEDELERNKSQSWLLMLVLFGKQKHMFVVHLKTNVGR